MSLKKLHITAIESSLLDFFKCVGSGINHFCKASINIKELSQGLILDDKKIKSKSELKMTNGRYFIYSYYDDYYLPCSDSKGVYVFFNKKEEAIYAGMSLSAIGNRVFKHIGKKVDEAFPYLDFEEADYVVSIPFDLCSCLAPAFESYLLQKYTFKYNSVFN